MANQFNVPDQLPDWQPMGDTQQSDLANQLAPSLDMLKLKVGQMKGGKEGGAGEAAAKSMGGMKAESL